MSSTGTGSVGSKDDQNLVENNDAVNAVEDDEKITNLIDADDGDTDGGDDQHGHHPNLVWRGQRSSRTCHQVTRIHIITGVNGINVLNDVCGYIKLVTDTRKDHSHVKNLLGIGPSFLGSYNGWKNMILFKLRHQSEIIGRNVKISK